MSSRQARLTRLRLSSLTMHVSAVLGSRYGVSQTDMLSVRALHHAPSFRKRRAWRPVEDVVAFKLFSQSRSMPRSLAKTSCERLVFHLSAVSIHFTEPIQAWVKTLPPAAYDDEPETVALVSLLLVTLGSDS